MPYNESEIKVAFCHLVKGAPMATLSETAKPKNSDRINCRISPAIKARAEEAAQVLGQSITAFTETALAEKAQTVLAEQERMVLSEQQFTRFVAILEDTTPPTPALVRAMQGYQETKAAHPDRGL
jgi:uncharacterized protein (DUF1778 family)